MEKIFEKSKAWTKTKKDNDGTYGGEEAEGCGKSVRSKKAMTKLIEKRRQQDGESQSEIKPNQDKDNSYRGEDAAGFRGVNEIKKDAMKGDRLGEICEIKTKTMHCFCFYLTDFISLQ